MSNRRIDVVLGAASIGDPGMVCRKMRMDSAFQSQARQDDL